MSNPNRAPSLGFLSLTWLLLSTASLGDELTIACGGPANIALLCKEAAETWAQKTGNTVNVRPVNLLVDARLSEFKLLLEAGADSVDVYEIDVIWTGSLGKHFLDLSPHFSADEVDAFIPQIKDTFEQEGALKAVPWFVSAGLLYVRKDLLKKHGLNVPATWEELRTTSRTILNAERNLGNTDLTGFVFQGMPYEGLTCNALEWIASSDGGQLLDADGNPTLDNPNAAAALARAASWLGDISSQAVTAMSEQETLESFSSGNAIFMRNWPYAISQLKESDLSDRFEVALLPRGSAPEATTVAALGGFGLAVSKYSQHPEKAIDLIKYLTSEQEQFRRAEAASLFPTRQILATRSPLKDSFPFFDVVAEAVQFAVPRPAIPAGEQYSRVSSVVWNYTFETLSGSTAASENLAAAAQTIREIMLEVKAE